MNWVKNHRNKLAVVSAALVLFAGGGFLVNGFQQENSEYIRFFDLDSENGITRMIEYDDDGTQRGIVEINALFCGLERDTQNNRILGGIIDEQLNVTDIAEYDLKTGEIHKLFPRDAISQEGSIAALHYIPGTSNISFVINTQSIYIFERKQGTFTKVKDADFGDLIQHEWLDSNQILYEKPVEVKKFPEVSITLKRELVSMDITTKMETALYGDFKWFSCSPDRQKLAILDRGYRVLIYDLKSKTETEIMELNESNTSMIFSPDGSKLLFYDVKRGFFSSDTTIIYYLYDSKSKKVKKLGEIDDGSYFPGYFWAQGVW